MTTTDHNVWARGATTSVVAPDTAPPAPPTYYPPTTEGGQPSPGGPRRKLPRWIATTAVIVAIAGAGVGGWALRGTQSPAATPATPSASPTAAAPTLTAEQAKQQTCDAYTMLGTQWNQAYHAWLPSVSGVNWRWDEPAVADATKSFSAAQAQIVIQLRALSVPGTPASVSTAVASYGDALLSLGAALGNASGTDTNARIDAVDAAAAAANRACGI